MPNADFDMLIAESMTLVVSRDLGRGLRRGTLEEEASKESWSLSLERAMRILERGWWRRRRLLWWMGPWCIALVGATVMVMVIRSAWIDNENLLWKFTTTTT